MKRKLRITVSKVRRQTAAAPPILRARCLDCGCEVELLDVIEANKILDIENQTLEALVFAGRVHAIETVSGSRWICKPSLFYRREKHFEAGRFKKLR